MCYYDSTQPFALPLRQHRTKNGILVMDYSLVLWKVTSKNPRDGEHWSSGGFCYPIGRTVYDANAIVGNHSRALHFAASPNSARSLQYGSDSHRLAVLPTPQVWKPVKNSRQTNRCWHSSGATTLFCCECDGIEFDVLYNPDFLKDLKRPARSCGGLVLRDLLESDAVWHQQVQLSCN